MFSRIKRIRVIRVADKGARNESRNGLPKSCPPKSGHTFPCFSPKNWPNSFLSAKIAMTVTFYGPWNLNEIFGHDSGIWTRKSPESLRTPLRIAKTIQQSWWQEAMFMEWFFWKRKETYSTLRLMLSFFPHTGESEENFRNMYRYHPWIVWMYESMKAKISWNLYKNAIVVIAKINFSCLKWHFSSNIVTVLLFLILVVGSKVITMGTTCHHESEV